MKKFILMVLFVFINVFLFANVEEAQKLFNEKKYQEAKTALEKILKENPKDKKAINLMGEIYKSMINSNPRNLNNYKLLMNFYKNNRRYSSFFKTLKRYHRYGGRYYYAELWKLSQLAFEIKDHDTVIYLTRRCNKLNPNNHSVLNMMGVSYYYLKKYRLSVIALKAAVKTKVDHDIYNANLARTYVSLGAYKKAYFYYKQALKYNPKLLRASTSIEKVKNLMKTQ